MNSPPIDAAESLTKAAPVKKSKAEISLLSYRFMIFYRFILALVGGYILASLSAVLIAQYFADQRSSAAMASTLIAFCVQAGAFIWVFMVNKTLKASLGIFIPSLVIFFLIKMLGN
jgi:hypothetical protein